MKFIFKNREFGKWLYQIFDERDVQEEIEKQWNSAYMGIEIDTSICVPCVPYENINARFVLSKTDILPSLEYKPNDWNLFPQTIPPEEGFYLVTVKYDNGVIQTKVGWYYAATNSWNYEIIAFRSLPDPYKPNEEAKAS